MIGLLSGCSWFDQTRITPGEAEVRDANTVTVEVEIDPAMMVPEDESGVYFSLFSTDEPVPLESLAMLSPKKKPRIVRAPTTRPSEIVAGRVRIPVLPGSRVRVKVTDSVTGNSRAKSAGLKTPDAQTAKAFKTGAPSAGRASAGDTSLETTLSDPRAVGPLMLTGCGTLLVIVGLLAAVVWGRIVMGLSLAVGGLILCGVGIFLEIYPWALWAIPLMFVVACGVFLFATRKGKHIRDTLKTVVLGVEQSDPGPGGAVKAKISEASEAKGNSTVVRATVRQAKREAGIS